MDRRSWLWRRKSSEKSPGETESSGSISSQSERFSGEQGYSIQNMQSPEVTSKEMTNDELPDDVKSLKEKLADALTQIRLKEDSARQHSKVAEEAVSGWEKAENEVLSIRQELEAVTQRNSSLEDRMNHLDGALQECVRQLRQTKQEQDQKIHDAISQQTQDWESSNSKLQSEVADLSIKLNNARTEVITSTERNHHLQSKLQTLLEENSNLKLELLTSTEELKVRNSERDYCIQAAETASRQYLRSTKKLTKLEAECARLRSLAHKAALINQNRSLTASSLYVESITDNQSECGDMAMLLEADLYKLGILESKEIEASCSDSVAFSFVQELDKFQNEKAHRRNLEDPSIGSDFMEDFVKMEKIVALPGLGSEKEFAPAGSFDARPTEVEITLKAELEYMINRTAELEEKLDKVEALNTELNSALTELRMQLHIAHAEIKDDEAKLENIEAATIKMNNSLLERHKQLQLSQTKLKKSEEKLVKLKLQLELADELKWAAAEEIKANVTQREEAESRLSVLKVENGALLARVRCLEREIGEEKSMLAEHIGRCQKLEGELSRIKVEAENKERALLAENLSRYQNLEDELSRIKVEAEIKERVLLAENSSRCQKLEDELLRIKTEAKLNLATHSVAQDFKIDQEKELEIAAQKFAECQKTIASLGRQLKSLATLEDFLLDSEKLAQTDDEVSHIPEQGNELPDLASTKLYIPKRDSELSISEADHAISYNPKDNDTTLSINPSLASDRSRTGFGKMSSKGKLRR